MSGGRLLVVEDDQRVRESLQRALHLEGFDVTTATDGLAALEMIASDSPDAVILDVIMPYVDGLGVARRMRKDGDTTPILMLTARHEVTHRVAGLDAGADDYLVKPFALEELLARIRALLRRGGVSGQSQPMRIADLSVDPAARRVFRGQREIILTKTEFDLLELLVFNARIVLPRDVIMDRIWGYDFPTTSNPLEVYVGYLRRKLESGGESRLIHTVRGVGYVARDS
ncbi:MAG: response regulator transcription factor [bacterium]|nr:response regulator transcription factor [bacterium]MDE0188346.1 response regulator transcription factor [bacterium]MDE0501766.1 response regulator transcription factor [bacterium]